MSRWLSTENLELRPYEAGDADAFVELFSDSSVARFMDDERLRTEDDRLVVVVVGLGHRRETYAR